MINIYTRSPFIVEIDESGQVSTKIELYIVTGNGTLPTSPSYTLSKLIPSSNVTATYYDVSNYIREFINHNTIVSAYDTDVMNTNTFAQVRITRYKNLGAGDVAIDTTDYLAFDGYTPYESGSNYENNKSMCTPITYYYNYDSNINLGVDFNDVPTTIGIPFYDADEYAVVYTNLSTGATSSTIITSTVSGGGTYLFPRQVKSVIDAYYAVGNKVEIKNNLTSQTYATYYFIPYEECKYTANKIDFVNKWGQYQRIWFFGASYDYVDSTSKEYMNKQSSLSNYSTIEGQMKEFNINGVKRIKVNSGWVDEEFKDVIEEILMSEKILVNGYPAKLTTKNVEKYKNINTKQINYELDFTFNYQLINSVS
jgi:hypothetical protein